MELAAPAGAGGGGGGGGHLPPPFVFPPYTKRALLVAADATRRRSLVEWHHNAGYVVTDCSNPVVATAILRDGGGGGGGGGWGRFSLAVLDAFPSCVGSFEFLRCAISEMRLRVHGISKDGRFWGPLDMEDLKIIGQKITRQTFNKSRLPDPTPHAESNSVLTMVSYSRSSKNQSNDTGSQEVQQDDEHCNDQPQVSKKTRIVWTDELHQKFVDAYNKLLPRDAVPKKILKLMKVDTLTRENVASHLQKYRLILNAKQLASPQESITPLMSQNKIYMADQVAQAVLNAKPMIGASMMNDIIQNNHPKLQMHDMNVKEVYPRDVWIRRCNVPREMHIKAEVGYEHDNASKSAIVDYHNNSDGNFQEDFNQIIIMNKDPEISQEHKYLLDVDYFRH